MVMSWCHLRDGDIGLKNCKRDVLETHVSFCFYEIQILQTMKGHKW